MSRRLALNDKGQLTYCTVDQNSNNTGRCNHILHQKEDENEESFYERMKYELDKRNKEHSKQIKQKALLKKIGSGITIAALSIVLVGCSSSDINKTIRIAKQANRVAKSIQNNNKKTDASSTTQSSSSSQNKKDIEVKNQDVNQLIQNVEVKEPQNVNYNRDLWGSNTPSYEYFDAKENYIYRTSSSNRAGFYNSKSYDKSTGIFTDPYDPSLKYNDYAGTEYKAKELGLPDNVNYDHIIPLGYVAQEIGGDDKWSANKRNTYAYDLTAGVTASQHLNNVKGSKGPSGFLPPNEKAAIKYCYTWLIVADKYDIPLAPNDMSTIKEVLSNAEKEDLTIINPYYDGTDTDGTN